MWTRTEPKGRTVDVGGMEITIRYEGESSTRKALRLDNEIIPLIVAAPDLYRLCASMSGYLYATMNPAQMPEDAKEAFWLIAKMAAK